MQWRIRPKISRFSRNDPDGMQRAKRPCCPTCLTAALSTSFTYILYFRILQIAGTVNVVLVTLVIPVNATLRDVPFLSESVASSEILGVVAPWKKAPWKPTVIMNG